MEISQKLGIDSAVLRQELKHAATTRSATQVKASAETQITGAERVLIRALASATQMQSSGTRTTAREGTDEEFDPTARRNMRAIEPFVRRTRRDVVDRALLEAGVEAVDVKALPKTENLNPTTPCSSPAQFAVHQRPLQRPFLQKGLFFLQRDRRPLQGICTFLSAGAGKSAQCPHRAFHGLGRQFFFLVIRMEASRRRSLRSSAAHYRHCFDSGFEQRFDQRLRGESLRQMLRLQRILRLAGGIEFLVGASRAGGSRSAGLHLRGEARRISTALRAGDLRFRRSFHLRRRARGGGVLQFLAEHRESTPASAKFPSPVRRARCDLARAECAEEVVDGLTLLSAFRAGELGAGRSIRYQNISANA